MPTEAEAQGTAAMPVVRVQQGERAAFAWSDFVGANKDAFSASLGWDFGKLLGCGYYGCVYQSTRPWIVKVTRDPTEGPAWAFIEELHRDPEIAHDMGGFLRVKDIARITPDVIWEEPEEEPRQFPVYAIQRESATPLLDRDEHGDTFITPRTADELQLGRREILQVVEDEGDLSADGMPMWGSVLDLLGSPEAPDNVQLRVHDLALFMTALNDYRKNAESYWRGLTILEYTQASFEREEMQKELAERAMRVIRAAKAITERPNGDPNMFGEVLGRTLHEAFDSADMAIADLHIFNVGWRDHAEVDGSSLPLTITVTDPGVAITPYTPAIRQIDLTEEALIRNGVDVAGHLGGLRRNPTEYESHWCTFCGGSAHPATGSVYGDRTIACRRCEQELWEWAQRHTNKRRYRKSRGAWEPSFYEAAVRK